ncbi:hypothetical protein DPMN_172447 [Dreissena polymorpha]|uniref:Uncharacterized protein n=1 Tax=Dreissena polymorpha TaxID=45954 RepID=A0A9D4E2C1_DREPO|nr:hypothetical protein DPMN_172447 [Dreissena polymorpha]
MPAKMNAGKRTLSSTASETSTNNSILETSVFENSDHKQSKTKLKQNKPDPKKQKTMTTFVTSTPNENCDISGLSIEKRLDEICNKLSHVLTKDDSAFIKDIIKETVEQLKDKLLGNVIRRIEILESDVFEHKREIDLLKQESAAKNKQIEVLKTENETLQRAKNGDSISHDEFANNTEQYSRRNNLRIAGVPEDQDRQSSVSVTNKIVSLVNTHLGISIEPHDIDIAHRLGKFSPNKNRPVIVRFVRRQIKIDILRKAKLFKGSGIFVNEDLTKLNAEVLASVRLKQPSAVDKTWSFEGKIFALFKGNEHAIQIKFADFKDWLEKPWPKKSYSECVETPACATNRKSSNKS